MQSGRQTLQGIEEALRDLKTQESQLEKEMEDANARRTTLVAERLEALRRLAAARTRDAMADGVINEADNLSQRVRASLAARLRTISQLKERQQQAEAERVRHVEAQDALTQRIAVLEDRLDLLANEARQGLASDPVFAEMVADHKALDETLQRATQKADQVARDEHEKGAPYRGDPLFMYLWQRRMGTPAYAATGLVRVLDEWVAGLVRYRDARANYAVLTEIPVRLRAHAEDLNRQTEAAKAEIDVRVAAKTRELAGEDLAGELTREREQQAELAKSLEAITSELAETGAQLLTYAKGEDQSLQSAVAAYAQLLEREPLRSLISDAASTQTREDDEIVEEVGRLAKELAELEAGVAGRRRRLDQISERRIELARLSSNFRRQRFDDVGSEFSNMPRTEDLLQLLLRGAITAAEYWIRMQQQQQWRDRPGDPWRRSSGLPPFDGFPGGFGGFGGGRGGGNSGGGGSAPSRPARDFETGGTF